MIVVADTSPLNYILQLGLIEDLHLIYGKIVVPTGVLRELRHPQSPQIVRLWFGSLPEWVELKSAHRTDPTLPLHLGAGETEGINLALEFQPSLLLIDDLPGRRAAEERNIQVTGTLTILLQMALLKEFDYGAKLDELRALGFRASESILKRVEEEFSRVRRTAIKRENR
jgi:predicted nucleic acid-binding protein